MIDFFNKPTRDEIIKNLLEEDLSEEEIRIKLIQLFAFEKGKIISESKINSSFRKIALAFHPDKVDKNKKKKAKQIFQILGNLKERIDTLLKDNDKKNYKYKNEQSLLEYIGLAKKNSESMNSSENENGNINHLEELNEECKKFFENLFKFNNQANKIFPFFKENISNSSLNDNSSLNNKIKNLIFNEKFIKNLDGLPEIFLLKYVFLDLYGMSEKDLFIYLFNNEKSLEEFNKIDKEYEDKEEFLPLIDEITESSRASIDKLKKVNELIENFFCFRENIIKFKLYLGFFQDVNSIFASQNVLNSSTNQIKKIFEKKFFSNIDQASQNQYLNFLEKVKNKKWFNDFSVFKIRFEQLSIKFSKEENKSKTKQYFEIIQAILFGIILFILIVTPMALFMTFFQISIMFCMGNFFKLTLKGIKSFVDPNKINLIKGLDLRIEHINSNLDQTKKLKGEILNFIKNNAIKFLIFISFVLLCNLICLSIQFYIMKESVYQKELDSYKINLLKDFTKKNNIENENISNLLNNKDFIVNLLFFPEKARKALKRAIGENEADETEIDEFMNQINEFYQKNYTVEGLEGQKYEYQETVLYFNLTSNFKYQSNAINQNIFNESFFEISESRELVLVDGPQL